jgi:hypothetical protein
MKLRVEPYPKQRARWPKGGRHILAQYDEEGVVVYQAYRPEIGRFAGEHGYFGGPFSFTRMSWVKPNFLWMMYRSGWGTKADQEVTLAVTIRRGAFDAILTAAVHSSFDRERYATEGEWKDAVATSDVRLQWDPDHGPRGEALDRRAVQLGLRGDALRRYGREWIVRIDDVSEFVREQREVLSASGAGSLLTPEEHVYPINNPMVARKIGVDVWTDVT